MLHFKRRAFFKVTAAASVASGVIAIEGGAAEAASLESSTFNLAMFGAKGAGQDDAQAIAALNEAVSSHLIRISDAYRSAFGYIQSGLIVDLTGCYCFSNTLIIYPGVEYRLPSGSILSALREGQTIVRTASRKELARFNSVYGCSATRMHGGGYIDGRNIASIGFLADTVTDCSKFEFTVVRCTYRRYRINCEFTNNSKNISVKDSKGINIGDVVRISGSKQEFFSIVSINNNELTLSSGVECEVDDPVLEHRACGVLGIDAQITYFLIQAQMNDIGWAFSKNADNIQCTDLRVTGKSEFNMIGLLVVSGDGRFRDITAMHNFDREIVIVDGVASVFDGVYLESMSDRQANTISPPVKDIVALQGQPLVDIRGGRSTWRDINWPTNPTSTSFRRLMRNRGDTLVENVVGPSVPLLAHPADPGDYAIFDDVEGGCLNYRDIRGWTNLPESSALRRMVKIH